MSKKRFHPRRATGGRLPLPRWQIEVVMPDGRESRHNGQYADAFFALSVAKEAFPDATRIAVRHEPLPLVKEVSYA